MKAFLEEYGMVIVGVIVVAALVIISTAVSKASKKSMGSTFNTFIGIGEGQVQGAANGVTAAGGSGAISEDSGNWIDAKDDLGVSD